MAEEEISTIEEQARADGWKPKENWEGDPEQWVDAETFVERGKNINGFLRNKNERLEARINKLEQANKKFGKYHKQQLQKQRQEAEKRIEFLENKLAEAIDNGDGQTYNMINKEIHNLRTNTPPAPDEMDDDEIELDPVSQEWLSNNSWYGQDVTLSTFADGAADRLRAQGYSGKAYYNELTRMVREAFPHKFQNPNRSRESNTNDDGRPGEDTPPKKHSYQNLPADARAACDEFVEAGIMTRAEYIKAYDWEDE